MIKNIIFDNGGVIIKYSSDTYLDYFNFPEEEKKTLMKIFSTDEYVELSKGNITHQEFNDFAVKMFPQYHDDVLKILDSDYYKYLIPVYSKTIEFIKDLRNRGYKTYLLTDILEDTIEYMKKEVDNFEQLFDGIVYSCRVGMTKRENTIFEHILNKFGLNPKETLFLDDKLSNLKRAESFGIKTYQFLNPNIDIPKIEELI